ncbi:hypothetical protein EB796_016374 [Bugula neritina]|uniref:Uncharacterized protein n=1 Tax=Bugula neritina TaxID=10212 RepID=A0A7J7JG78_BUGNE|nr:hypothetical protein EB796_016374 [Bugula neritina]
MSILLFVLIDKEGLTIELPMLIGNVTEISTTSDQAKRINNISQMGLDNSNNYDSTLHANNPGYLNSYSGVKADNTWVDSFVTSKKHKDMMRKRVLRQSSDYRQQETVRSRNRMKLRRSNPEYREKERKRDRERRRLARTTNPEKRAIERERDRLYKKRIRSDSKVEFIMSASTVSHEVVLHDSHSEQQSLEFDSVLDNSHSNNLITISCMSDNSGGIMVMDNT